jgi:hypothetical protein
MTGFDQLERQLLDSVGRRASPLPDDATRPRRWRGPSRRGLAVALMPLAFAAAAAGAIIARTGESPSMALLGHVLRGTDHTAACSSSGARRSALSEDSPYPQITAVLPGLATFPRTPPPAAAVALARNGGGGPVLARTIRVVNAADGIQMLLFVARGNGPFTLLNPETCLRTRLALLDSLRPNPHDQLRLAVARSIRAMRDTNPGLESVSLLVLRGPPGIGRGSGSSVPVLPGAAALPTGEWSAGQGCRHAPHSHRPVCSPIVYTGVAGPGVASIAVRPSGAGPAQRKSVQRRVAVSQGVFAFTLPLHHGPEVLVELARDGATVRTVPLR